MSGTKGTRDRRTRKTRQALVDSFSHLVLERHYDEIRVGDVVREADVGRSTFYQHYTGKEDLLVASMAGILNILADVCEEDSDVSALERILSHFWEQRVLARDLFAGPSSEHVAPRITRELARRIGFRIEARGAFILPHRLIALQTAEAQFALIKSWLSGAAQATPENLAQAMHRSTRASLQALLLS